MATRHEKEKGVNVQVLLRCRPFSDEEIKSNAPQVVTCNEYQREVSISQSVAGKHFDRIFTFDKVFGPSAQQKDLYDLAVTPIVNEVLEGFNCTIFAYGQTGTGKTYTMEGECKRSKTGPNGELPAEAGVIPRAVKQIFDTLESQNAEYSVKVTFLELYNEEITDLLAPEEISKVCTDDKQKKQLPLMEDGKGGVLVRGLEEEIVTSATEIFTLLERGSAKRRTAETLLNKQSSRSHSLFSITIHIKEPTPEGEELIKCGKLNLVDLAGSENISRSGAREGRAREAGEINKSLLTLGRVINALVEHVGHIPYRDSKLTRLLRDSLGGRTKTCIIATVSPAVHCLEETLSTLDYAHRAKNIKNKPEVNQKMMKSTLIKDLYGEIERLKADVYAAREKNGVYIPRDRYTQEEIERKAMAEQITQLSASIESYQKQLDDLQEKYDDQVKQCESTSSRLDATEKALYVTKKSLSYAEEEWRKLRYTLKEKDFIISEHKKSENALTQQACALRLDLEKAVYENEMLHNKIGGGNKLNIENKLIVTNFKDELSKEINSLCDLVNSSVSQQNDHFASVNQLCNSFLTHHSQAMKHMRDKVETSRRLHSSHSAIIQKMVFLHKANSVANFEEIFSMQCANFKSIQEILVLENSHATSIFNDLQSTLSDHQGEMAVFARDLRQKFERSNTQTRTISDYMHQFLQKLSTFSSLLDSYASESEEFQMKTISDFHKAFEEQCDAEKLAAEINTIVNNIVINKITNHIAKQKEVVNLNLIDLRIQSANTKSMFHEHSNLMKNATADAKRKWQQYSSEADNNVNESIDYASAKHCRMENLLEQCASLATSASHHWSNAIHSVNEMGISQESTLHSFIRSASKNADLHVSRVTSACEESEGKMEEESAKIMQQIECTAEQGEELVKKVGDATKQHEATLDKMKEGHSVELSAILENAKHTFERRYMDHEPTGSTPVRWAKDVPTKAAIESLKAMPMENLEMEFRENNSYESFEHKDIKPSLIPRSPLSLLN